MYYVYVLKSRKTSEIYVGSTSDLRERFLSHNGSKNLATKKSIPWGLVYYEAYSRKELALNRERQLKCYGKGLAMLKERVGL